MARLFYGATPADFAVALGASTPIPDTSPVLDGRVALIPEASVTLLVYDAPGGNHVIDLQTAAGVPISDLDTSTDEAALGTIPRFQGPDGWQADLWVSSDGTHFLRLAPSTDDLHERVTNVEGALESVQTSSLVDWDNTGRANGNVPVWNSTTGKWRPGPAGSGSVSKVANISPDGNGNVPITPADIGAGTASGQAALAAIATAVLVQVGAGYPPRPSLATTVTYIGTATPTTGLVNGDRWHQPAVTP